MDPYTITYGLGKLMTGMGLHRLFTKAVMWPINTYLDKQYTEQMRFANELEHNIKTILSTAEVRGILQTLDDTITPLHIYALLSARALIERGLGPFGKSVVGNFTLTSGKEFENNTELLKIKGCLVAMGGDGNFLDEFTPASIPRLIPNFSELRRYFKNISEQLDSSIRTYNAFLHSFFPDDYGKFNKAASDFRNDGLIEEIENSEEASENLLEFISQLPRWRYMQVHSTQSNVSPASPLFLFKIHAVRRKAAIDRLIIFFGL